MTTLFAGLIGYAIGSLPTANALARTRNIDLRRSGSGNPGTNNARQLGGMALAVPVLLVEILKGAICVVVGAYLAGDVGSVIGAIGGISGNVFNIWYRFRGGKGLAITGGVLAALWPAAFLILVLAIALSAAATRSTGLASLIAVTMMVAIAFVWVWRDLPNGWGIEETTLLPYFAIASAAILVPKHLRDARGRSIEASRP